MLGLLKDIQSKSDADRIRVALNPVPSKPQHRRPEPYPNALPVLASRPRPLSQLSSRRHVPVLTGANGVPFLRFKKPQSPFLSRVIKDKIHQRQKWLDHIKRMEPTIALAAGEDKWDSLIAREGVANDGASWERTMRHANRDPEDRLRNASNKAIEVSRKMLKIVDEERRLFEEESKERKKERHRMRRERKMNRGRSADSDEPAGSRVAEIDANSSSSDSS